MSKYIPRLYLESYSIFQNGVIVLTDTQHHYLYHILRVQPGSKTILFNALDGEWLCIVEATTKTFIKLRVSQQLRSSPVLPETHLYFAPIRKERLIDILEKGTELGVTHFHPILTDHTVHQTLNMNKLRLYIQDAVEQCGRCDIPQLFEIVDISKIISEWNQKIHLFWALEGEDLPTLNLFQHKEAVHIALGPEGGWSEQEKKTLKSMNFVCPFSLGHLTLRSETAAISSLAVLNYLRTLA